LQQRLALAGHAVDVLDRLACAGLDGSELCEVLFASFRLRDARGDQGGFGEGERLRLPGLGDFAQELFLIRMEREFLAGELFEGRESFLPESFSRAAIFSITCGAGMTKGYLVASVPWIGLSEATSRIASNATDVMSFFMVASVGVSVSFLFHPLVRGL
jgi:hypothetical protein